ncbi:excitatory amino acid transporter 3-like [Babylonia areolata]|uniref:excitatory amino acid transporter 3-like n=1 Tax=Babylonia areolata TaxID=304850 RepID=UPI003FD687E7
MQLNKRTSEYDDNDQKRASDVFQRMKRFFVRHALVISMLFALFLGVVLGQLLRLRSEPYSETEKFYLRFPGDLLVNMLYLLVLPFVVSSIITGQTMIDLWALGRLGLRTGLYFLVLYLVATLLGIVLALLCLPKQKQELTEVKHRTNEVGVADIILDLFRQMFPRNLVEATFVKSVTVIKNKNIKTSTPRSQPDFSANASTSDTTEKTETVREIENVEGMNMLGVIVISLAAGVVINILEDKGRPLKVFFEAVYEVSLVLINVAIWYSPVGVLFLVMEDVAGMESSTEVFRQTSYFVTCTAGLLAHVFLIMPAIYFIICRQNPYTFMEGMMQAMVTAISVSSSMATLPVTMRNVLMNDNVDPRVVGFVAPVGASVNMSGTAIFEAVAVIFIGYAHGMDLGFSKLLVIGLTSIVASIATPGVPQGGVISIMVVLKAVGIPPEKVGLVISLDWILDRFQTVTNILSDAYGCAIITKLSLKDLGKLTEEGESCSDTDSTSEDTSSSKTNSVSAQAEGSSQDHQSVTTSTFEEQRHIV